MNKTQLIILAGLALTVLVVCLIVSVLAVPLLLSREAPPPTAIETPGPTPTSTVLTFTGEGDDFIMFDNPKSGLAAFGIRHIGEHFFSVMLNDANGGYLALLAIENGKYEGQSVEHLDRGSYIIEIKADGPWYVVIGLPE